MTGGSHGRRGWTRGTRALRLSLAAGVLFAFNLGCLGSLIDRGGDVSRIVGDEGIQNVSVTRRDGDGLTYDWEGRRDWTACSGSVTFGGAFEDHHTLEQQCGTPLPLAALSSGCDAGQGQACARAAAQLREAEGDVAEMTRYATRACELGEHVECLQVGIAMERGDRGVPQNLTGAFENYVRACDARSGEACFFAASLRYEGRGTQPQHDVACDYWRRACELEFTRACADLGQCYRDGEGVPRDYARAQALLTRACDANVALGCTNLGRMFELGQGTPVNFPQAYSAYARGCAHGDTRGCRSSAVLLLDGRAGLPNRLDGYRQLEQLCSQNDQLACLSQGMALHEGRVGLPRDQRRAFTLFAACCARGVASCCNNAGVYTRNGWGGAPRSEAGARVLFRQACERGDQTACRNL